MTTNREIQDKILGIDLGTTNSVVAILEGAIAVTIENQEGFKLTPSIVSYSSPTELLIGQAAKRQTILNPKNTFYSVKRFIGCKFNEIKNEILRISYTITKGINENVKFLCPIINKEFSPEEISSIIIKKLAQDASRYLNTPVYKAIITVPAYFNDSQRLATQDAGFLAGLNVLRIINEPTAAALAYGLEKRINEIALIFDLGGGTFDVSILEIGDSVFEVLASDGDTHLGGDDFDKIIFDFIIENFKIDYNIDLKKINNEYALQRILEASEKAKIELSDESSTVINIPYIYYNIKYAETLNIRIKFSRTQFDILTKDLIHKCRNPINTALNSSNMSIKDIDQIILVGGSTRIPAIKNLLNMMFHNKILNESVNPDEVVALGAAIQAGVISGEIQDLILLDVTPLSLGIEILGGKVAKIIPRNTSIPTRRTDIFSTSADYQNAVDVHILQGERELVSFNKSLGHFLLTNIPKALKGIPIIKVTFDINTDGLLHVSAYEETSGNEQSIKINGSCNISREEISRMIDDAKENTHSDYFLIEFFNIFNIYSDILLNNIFYNCYFTIIKNFLKFINNNLCNNNFILSEISTPNAIFYINSFLKYFKYIQYLEAFFVKSQNYNVQKKFLLLYLSKKKICQYTMIY